MTYTELLSRKEWPVKCNEILNLAHYKCNDCGCLGFHNGGNFLKLENLNEIDEFLKSYTFYDRSFSSFYQWIPEDILIDERIKDIVFIDKEIEHEFVTICHFRKPIIKDIADIDSFPVVYEKSCVPTKIVQRPWHWGIRYLNNAERIGKIYEFSFPNCHIHSLCACIEESDNVDYITIQINNRIFALVFSKEKQLFKGLNIHHKYYIVGHKPWEYDNDALVTLCKDCHQKRHLKSPIYVYDDNHSTKGVCEICDRCGGSGYLPQYSYVQKGICFKCGGEGVLLNDKEFAL